MQEVRAAVIGTGVMGRKYAQMIAEGKAGALRRYPCLAKTGRGNGGKKVFPCAGKRTARPKTKKQTRRMADR